jgi:hypothetical protein
MKKINLKHGLSISKSNIATLQDEHLQQIKGGRGLQLAKASTKGPVCSCETSSCNKGQQTIDNIVNIR